MTSLQDGTRDPARFTPRKKASTTVADFLTIWPATLLLVMQSLCVVHLKPAYDAPTDLDLAHGLARRLALSSHFSRRDICLPNGCKDGRPKPPSCALF